MTMRDWSGDRTCFRCGSIDFSTTDCPVCIDQRNRYARWLERADERAERVAVEEARIAEEEQYVATRASDLQCARIDAHRVIANYVSDNPLSDCEVTHDRELVQAAFVLKSGWIGNVFFLLSRGKHMVRLYNVSSPHLPEFARTKRGYRGQ